MTDKETSLAFVERIRTLDSLADLTITERVDLLKLAETAALIDEHNVQPRRSIYTGEWTAKAFDEQNRVRGAERAADLHTAVRAVADKIKEGK